MRIHHGVSLVSRLLHPDSHEVGNPSGNPTTVTTVIDTDLACRRSNTQSFSG
jgi:hypothetical protein